MIQLSMKTSSDIRVGEVVGLLKVTATGPKKFDAECISCGKELAVSRAHINKILKSGKMHGCSCSRRKHTTDPEYRWRFASYKQAAKKRGLDWQLTYEQFLDFIKLNCYYCGTEPEMRPSHSKRWGFTFLMSGLDRTDTSAGYTVKNIVPCCTHCNRAKWDYSKDEFYSWLDRVAAHREGVA